MKIEKINVKQERTQNVFLKVAFSAGKRGFDDAKLRALERVAKTSCVCGESFTDAEKEAANGAVEAFRDAISRAITLLEFSGPGLGVFVAETEPLVADANGETVETNAEAESEDAERATDEPAADAE